MKLKFESNPDPQFKTIRRYKATLDCTHDDNLGESFHVADIESGEWCLPTKAVRWEVSYQDGRPTRYFDTLSEAKADVEFVVFHNAITWRRGGPA